MPVIMKHKRRSSLKRHTWPRTQIDQLETIPESPRTPTKSQQATDSQSPTRKSRGEVCQTQLGDQEGMKVDDKAPSLKVTQAQMIWYSHHLTESQREREKLWNKLEEIEGVCRNQSKANEKLRQDVSSWQKSCEEMEIELAGAAQEVKDANTYIRDLEMANGNLRCAVSQVREEQERDRQRRWRNRLQRCFKSAMQLPIMLCIAGSRKASIKDSEFQSRNMTRSEPATPPSRPSMRKDHKMTSRPPSRMSGSFTSDHSPSSTLNPPVDDDID